MIADEMDFEPNPASYAPPGSPRIRIHRRDPHAEPSMEHLPGFGRPKSEDCSIEISQKAPTVSVERWPRRYLLLQIRQHIRRLRLHVDW